MKTELSVGGSGFGSRVVRICTVGVDYVDQSKIQVPCAYFCKYLQVYFMFKQKIFLIWTNIIFNKQNKIFNKTLIISQYIVKKA